jgi:Protein of unknown function (DUF2892).
VEKNVGTVDSAIRVVIGLALLSLMFVLEGDASAFGLIGLVPIYTALIEWCPAYLLFGITTCHSQTLGNGNARLRDSAH